jgi:putative ABC transport system permease protein
MTSLAQASPTPLALGRALRTARPKMAAREVLSIAIDSFQANRAQFLLTALGMVIGTASVILVVTIGLTGKQFILSEIQKIGTNEVELEYGGVGSASVQGNNVNGYLTREDERAVVAQLPDVQYSSPVVEMHDRISLGGGAIKESLILGVSPDYRFIRNLLVPDGRFFDEMDDAGHAKCAVVSETFARRRFGSSEDALMREIRIREMPFTIIGVFHQSVSDFGESEIADETILIPYSVSRFITGSDEVKQIYFSMRSMNEVNDATSEIESIVHGRHRPNAVYRTQDLTQVLSLAAEIANIVTAILVLVAAVTLTVGGVGIMNIMLATVRSRIREIGIRKALGATRLEIKRQFLYTYLWARLQAYLCRSLCASLPRSTCRSTSGRSS